MHLQHRAAEAGRTRASDHTLRVVRLVAVLLFAAWVGRYIREPETILHGSILVFHEAGHVLFMPFGEFMMVLGGSLFQLMVPGFLIGYFVWRRDFFAACFATLYLAASLDNLARYIADARAGELPLLGGERSNHDWTFLLIELNRLDSDITIGRFVHNCAIMLFWLSVPTALWLAWHTDQSAPERAPQHSSERPPTTVITSSWKEP
jgi:hypothetical protein